MKRRHVVGLILAAALPIGATTALAAGGGGGGGGAATGADLQLGFTSSTATPAAGAAYTYSIQVKNTGPETATNVVVDVPIPAGFGATITGLSGVSSCTGGPSGATNSLECTIDAMLKGNQATMQIAAQAPSSPATYSLTASVSSAVADPNPTNNSKVVPTTIKAPTGGVCKGGVCDTGAPPPPATPCATLPSVSAPVGYYSIWAAVWNDFTVSNCSSGAEAITVQVTETNVFSGSVDYDVTMPVSLLPGQNLSYVLDNDFAPFSTNYRIDYTVRDSAGNVLTTNVASATTMPAI